MLLVQDIVSPIEAPWSEFEREFSSILVEQVSGTTPTCMEEALQGGFVGHHSAVAETAMPWSANRGIASSQRAVRAKSRWTGVCRHVVRLLVAIVR